MSFLLKLLLFYLLYRFIKGLLSLGDKKTKPTAKAEQKTVSSPREMVQCAKCEVYLLKNDTKEQNGKYYCNPRCGSN
ncbi:MAG: hypothetical protein COX62_06475 [Deltaproteobacteria bacterium CG_4_10_14_0_2_um_filter_43_8]|nr:MAG: hypothetical protein COV43_07420 [Deltaproteobacteria bacterium CG11_big_fil_rev_8_21_14_0_20_42_23]PJA19561.1 MAG: hypothetical protein COX62_06475 [Deltaproteobacteria bacterium CG_4_10_14_0_2_um_filter_43_8]PJC63936.1 MAG: hypothetical protein CO021_06915 [Deltaproteobacteria bacterium CG_4_9_14_0_2_um_filter_42_21]